MQFNYDPDISNWNVPLMKGTKTATGFTDEIIERPTNQPLLTQRYTKNALEFIETQASNDNPFFLYLAYTMPHIPLFASDEFNGKSDAGIYGDVIEEIDWSVGEIRKSLEEKGIDKNTLVIFSSDNGPWLVMDEFAGSAGLLKDGKGTTFDGGMRVPGIFWWPQTIEPAVVRDIGNVMDIYSTVLSITGTENNAKNLDSIDLSTALKGGSSPRNSTAFYRKSELYAYRLGQYKLHFVT